MVTRTHQAVLDRTTQEPARDPVPMQDPTPTAVIAHGHGDYAERLRHCLQALGIRVLDCSDSAPDALGTVIAEQRSALLVSDQLVMMTGRDLLRQAAAFAPHTVLTAQHCSGQDQSLFTTGAHATFPCAQPPHDLAVWLSHVLGDQAAQAAPGRAPRPEPAARHGRSR